MNAYLVKITRLIKSVLKENNYNTKNKYVRYFTLQIIKK